MVKKTEHHISSTCPIACGLDIIGDHWTLLIIRAIMLFDMHEYKEFLSMPENIASNILSDRLKKLEENGIISSIPHPNSKRRKLYYLKQKGKNMLPILLEIGRWSRKNIKERVELPDHMIEVMTKSPEKIKEAIFAKIEEWEQTYLT